MRERRFMVYWTRNEEYHTDYIRGEYVQDVLKRLGVTEDDVIEVAVCMENWKNSKNRQRGAKKGQISS